MSFINLLLSIAKAVPIVDKWIEQLSTLYFQTRIAEMKKENRDAIKTALEKQDQRDLERALGSTIAGEPSGTPGSEIIDKLPGVP